MVKTKKYTDEDIIYHAAQVTSLAGLLKELGLRYAGGNYANMKKHLQRLDVKTDHWTGQAWNKDQQLKNWSDYRRSAHMKPHLIRERGHKCEDCGLSIWKDQKIALEIHHIDGDRTHNDPSNLQLLCPNCHACTDTWRSRNRKKLLS